MNYLFIVIAMCCWTITAFNYRVVENFRGNRFSMAAAMGFSSALCALIYGLVSGHDMFGSGPAFFGLGGGQGMVQIVLIPVFMAAVSRGDLSVTWTILTLSFALSSAMALVHPGAQPTALGIVGLSTAVAAVAMLGVDMRQRALGPAHRQPRQGWMLFMVISFLLNAAANYFLTLQGSIRGGGGMEGKLAFLAGAGVIFGLGGVGLVIFGQKGINYGRGILGGIVGGIMLFVGTMFSLVALERGVPDYLLYPSTTGGSGVLVVALSVVLLKERPGKAGWVGIAAGLAALVMFGLATGR